MPGKARGPAAWAPLRPRPPLRALGGHRPLDGDEIEELAERIDTEREGAALMRRCAQLPAVERAAIELVDLEGLTPKEAALSASPVSHFESGCPGRGPG